MIDTLNSIYLRLDVDMQNLAEKALAQLIVKIVYSTDNSMSKTDIKAKLKEINAGLCFNEAEIDNILAGLASKELSYHNGRFSLSKSKREKITLSVKESDKRREEIIEKYFAGLNSNRAAIVEWFTEMSLKFFEAFSDEWISDLLANTDHITSSADSIREQVTRRTMSMRQIDNDDKVVLPNRFFTFVNSHEDLVDSYLWEYGTSDFASKLIRNKHGVDKLTIDTFKNSYCIFDTNVLLFIVLENKYQGSFKAIEKVFEDLNIRAGVLYITKREYENKVSTQKYETLSNLEKFGYEITTLPNDDFTKMALQCGCKEQSDFDRFFDTTLSLPTTINSRVPISIKDDDKALAETIDIAQSDPNLLDKLNEISKRIARKPKRESACRHDVGLIEGVRYLRGAESEDNKFFILTDDTSINYYSKEYGLKQNLPLALRVDTLINMLAINNGGDTFDAADYRALFANIIRLGLMPRKDTFRQSELYQLSQMNVKLKGLPSDQVRYITMEMHRRFLEGMPEEDIRRDLNEMVTKGEIAAKDEIEKTNEKIDYERSQKKLYQSKSKRDRDNLIRTIKQQIEKDFDRETCKKRVCLWLGLTMLIAIILCVLGFIYKHNSPSETRLEEVVIGLVGGLILEIILGLIGQSRMIKNRTKKREIYIENETQRRLTEIDNS